ncbi:MAG TPA: PLP-dependent aspartate aminotransferase family protein [Terriglobales bacterium]|nr:PLP-dependent aspartate aminotransferase family protein [Terriglobales bacterium]
MSFDARGLSTRTIHGNLLPDSATGALLTPIYQTTTYVQEAVGVHKGFTYSRAANPTVSALEDVLGSLEGAPTLCFSTGMAAITTLFLSLLKQGDHAVISDVVYGGTVRLFRQILEDLGVRASFVDTSDPSAVTAAIGPTTRLIFIETPANPTLKLTDVAAIASIAHKAGVLLAVDNTFLTAALQPVLELGADISVLSTTKYIEGHNATVGGSLATKDSKLLDRFRLVRKTIGCIQSPLESWLTLRGLKTLSMRLERHSQNATTVARWLEQHPGVTRAHYPGLESFPQHALACRQHSAHGGMLSFEVAGGVPAGLTIMNSVKLCSLAENLGAAETLITHPASMTHADIPAEQREALGIGAGLIRLSVGLEDPKDIIADLEQALEKAESCSPERSRTCVATL